MDFFRRQTVPVWTLGVFFLLAPDPLAAADFTLGVNYPGAMIGLRAGAWAFEVRGQGQDDTTLIGLRVNRLFVLSHPRHLIYIGLEAARFEHTDETTDHSTAGTLGGAFLGLETFVTRHVSLAVDAGPYFASAEDQGQSEGLFDFVANASVNFHWRGRKP